MERPDPGEDGAGLNWLFLDLNSFFASVEQQKNPDWRGRPVIVRPAVSEYTCAIAASREAKAMGVRTGTPVRQARALCPGLIVAEARPDLYVEVHKQVMRAIDLCLPIWKVCSIDEAACRLTGPDRRQENAVAVARRMQAAIKDAAGGCLGASVGLAPSRFLAKTASGLDKNGGVAVLRADALPHAILDIPLKAYPGVGPRMRKRLAAAGIVDTEGLWRLEAKQARALWSSIEGERIWRGLHGLDSADPPVRPTASISHSHVLGAALRNPAGARAVARRLTVKCGARLRRLGLAGAGFSLHLDLGEGGGRGWGDTGVSCAVPPTCDTFVLLEALDGLWRRIARRLPDAPLSHVGVAVFHLKPLDAFAPDLFDPGPDQGGQARTLKLSRALDVLNRRYGKDTVSIGPRAVLPDYIGAKIAFNRIPKVDDFWE